MRKLPPFWAEEAISAWVQGQLIENNGNVGIGTTSPSRKLDVAGNVIANAYDYHSDFQLKKNIASIDNSLDKVLALRGVEFEWRLEEYPEK